MSAQVGLLLPSRESVLWANGDPRPMLALAAAAEKAGWDSLWAGDSIVARPRLDPIALLSAVAARTSNVTLGTAVYLPLLRNAVVSAHMLATLDRLAGGRLVVGVGPAASIPATDDELRAVGAPVGRRVDRLLETVSVWRDAWTSATAGMAPARDGGPPVWLAAAGPRTLRLTGTMFDGWLPYAPTSAAFRDALAVVREAERSQSRPSVVAGMYLTVCLGEPDAAARELDAFITGYYGIGVDFMREVQACFAGPAEAAAAWIRGYIAEGAQHIVIRLGHRDISTHERVAATLRDALG